MEGSGTSIYRIWMGTAQVIKRGDAAAIRGLGVVGEGMAVAEGTAVALCVITITAVRRGGMCC